MSRRFAIIGYGAITDEMVRTLEALGALSELAGVLVRSRRLEEAKRSATGRFPVVGSTLICASRGVCYPILSQGQSGTLR